MHRRAFTLLELTICVAVLALIVAVAIPQYANATDRSRYQTTQFTFINFEKGLLLYASDYRDFPDDYPHHQFPTPLARYINREDWSRRPPLGEYWEWNNPRTDPYWSSLGCNLAIRDTTRPDQTWGAFDNAYDDGDLDTGTYRRMGDYLCRPIK